MTAKGQHESHQTRRGGNQHDQSAQIVWRICLFDAARSRKSLPLEQFHINESVNIHAGQASLFGTRVRTAAPELANERRQLGLRQTRSTPTKLPHVAGNDADCNSAVSKAWRNSGSAGVPATASHLSGSLDGYFTDTA